MRSSAKHRGNQGEALVLKLLQQKGYKILERNYIFRKGEIDVIARDRGCIVFIEVKARHGSRFGQPFEAVTNKKQQLLRRTAEGYLYQKRIKDTDCRFDVISLLHNDNGEIEIEHFQNAFF